MINNAESKCIMWEDDAYHLKHNINVSGTVRRLVSEVADLGWLHEKISQKYSTE